MIIRSYFACETCETPHVVRIGLGQEARSSHNFNCSHCDEEIVVDVIADPSNHIAYAEPVGNCVRIEDHEAIDAAIINLDANFLIPRDQKHTDTIFPRIFQMQQMIDVVEKRNSNTAQNNRNLGSIPSIGMQDQWKLLKKSWSLKLNNKDKLSIKRMNECSSRLYPDDDLNSLSDWIFRFCAITGGEDYHLKFQNGMKEISELRGKPEFEKFLDYYQTKRMERERKYFDIFRTFFSNYSEFAQIWYHVSIGVPLEEGAEVGSINFESVKLFYGEAYEAFSSNVDVLACLNNLILGREFSVFANISLTDYLRLDKHSRFKAFELNEPFSNLCLEKDNKLRNASHHGSMVFNPDQQRISFRTGKGSQGELIEISYTDYLEKSVRIFLQIMKLLQIELVMCSAMERSPIGS